MRRFTILWLGQLVSMIGSAMTWFALTLWAWDETGKASTLSTIAFFAFLPSVLFSPLAGALVDRWNRTRNRKLVLSLSDLATALGTLTILLIYSLSDLQIWHIYLISILAGFFTAFQYPAFSSAVTAMLTRAQYARAEGMLASARALSGILAPILAAALLGIIGLRGIMVIDLATFLFALLTLLMIRIPRSEITLTGLRSRGTLRQEVLFGFRYIREERALRSLTFLFMATGIFLAIGATLIAPLVLDKTQGSESALATVQASGAVGGIAGGALLGLSGGTKRRIHNVLIGGAGACLLGIVGLGVGGTILLWGIGVFFFSFFEPFVEGGNLAIWATKVPPDVQGRVFASRHWLVQIPYLIGVFISGYLVEAAPISVILILAGLAGTILFAGGYSIRSIREAEE